MRLRTYIGRSLTFHARAHLPVALGVMVATATLTGALLVGDSMRLSLRDMVLGRLGRVDHALVAQRFFREKLAVDLAKAFGFPGAFSQACPVVVANGGITHADKGTRVNQIDVFGVDDRFWKLAVAGDAAMPRTPARRSVIVNQPLAEQLEVQAGDDLLIRVAKWNPVSTETLLGQRDDTRETLRLTVERIIPARGLGSFTLSPRQPPPANAWIPLATLQRALDQTGRVNAMLVDARKGSGNAGSLGAERLQRMLQECVVLEDFGLRLRSDPIRGYLAVEADSLLIEPVVETAALAAAESANLRARPILTYLANAIAAGQPSQDKDPPPVNSDEIQPGSANPPSEIRHPKSVIPYSTVTALETSAAGGSSLTIVDGAPAPALEPGEILLNEWAAADLDVGPGDRVTLTYYVTGPFGRLDTRHTAFVLRGIVRLDDLAADPGFAPHYPGVTDTENLADWDPPFPIDLKLVRDRDERYWDRHRAAPKAFISLAEGRRLWTEGSERFGRATSIRILPGENTDLPAPAAFRAELLRHLKAAQLGLAFEPARERALAASTGSTDFGILFICFSFFLIVSAAMLVALLFRLGTERRAGEIGLLLATGFPPRTVTRLLVTEGAVVAGIGAAVGLLGAVGYAWFMLAGLRSWWSDAVNAPFLHLYLPPASLIIGFCVSFIIALASIAWSIRSLARCSTRALLAETTRPEAHGAPPRRRRRTILVGFAALALAVALMVGAGAAEAFSSMVGFFGGGAALVIAALSVLKARLDADPGNVIQRPGLGTLLRLGVRNAPRHPGRSLLTAGLIASATFVIIAIEALHLDPNVERTDQYTPAGGFALLAESAIPLPYDLNSADGREALGLTSPAGGELPNMTAMPFRLRPGDDSSCRNLYRPTQPRILGVPEEMIERGGFVFSSTLATSEEEEHNPWVLLNRKFPDDAVPVIGDESAVLWQFHLGVGQDLVVKDERGRDVRLRFVALLAHSVLQNELCVAESRFVDLFPSVSGHAFFLLDVPLPSASALTRRLERRLDAYAFDVTPTSRRLAEYYAVQNTYLSTFQTLGGLGLVLGTVGLAVVLLRNAWERRSELALMRALGFSRAALGWMALAENAVLVVAGLAAGALPALVAIAPHIADRPAELPWMSVALTLLAVLIVGIGAGALALLGPLRAPLIPALRLE